MPSSKLHTFLSSFTITLKTGSLASRSLSPPFWHICSYCDFDTSPLQRRGILLSFIQLARPSLRTARRGQMSRSVLPSNVCPIRSCMPYSTGCFVQDVQRRILISIHHQATRGAHMRSHTERLFDACATGATILAGEVGRNRYHRNVVYFPVVVDPCKELPPGCIADRFGEVMVLDHVTDRKLFIGNQVVRRDKRVRLLSGEIFTLPLYLQMSLSKFLLCLFTVLGLLGTFGMFALKFLQSFLCFA